MKTLDCIILTLIIVGALNWGLVGFFDFNLVTTIFGGSASFISRIIFGVIGICGIYGLTLYGHMSSHKK